MRKITYIVIIGFIIGIVIFANGYRLNPISAAKRHFDISESGVAFGNVDFKDGSIYCFNTEEGPRTALVEKKLFFLWKCSSAVYFEKDNKDDVKTIAWESLRGKGYEILVIAFETNVEDVYYIEAGPEQERIKKKVITNEPIIFHWNKCYNGHQLDAIALSKEGKVLYKMGYHKKIMEIKPSDDFKWSKKELVQ